MSNSFSREERVAFETVLEGFHDQLVLSKNVAIYKTDAQTMERANNVIWRPMPYIAQSHDGTDATSNFDDATQLAVPAQIAYAKHSTALLTAQELNDALQENRLGEAAAQKLASDINVSVVNVAGLLGSVVIKRTSAASGYDDAAQIDSALNEIGITTSDRKWALSSRDYNNMAKDLANRSTMTGKPTTAYEDSYVGRISSLDTYKLDYSYRLAAAAGGAGLTMDTRTSASNYYVPRATSTATTGEISNVDNRYQTITVSSTTNVAAGDAFTVAGIDSVHLITKNDTGNLKTYRVVSVTDATHLVITPPMITGAGNTDAEIAYKNCTVSGSGSATAAIVFLNTVAAQTNPFWHKGAIEIMPGKYSVPSDAGVAVMRASTDQGIELVCTKFMDINTYKVKYRWDTRWGVTMLNTQMCGIQLFSQS